MHEQGSQRTEALLMALLSLAYDGVEPDGDPDRDTKVFKILARGGVKGSEIAQVFGVSEATVSRRLKG